MAGPVVLVRHALSTWNLEGRWQGQADPPLSAAGEAQSREAAARLGPVDLVVTSGLARADRTAALLAPGIPAVVEVGLREYDVGSWSGRTRDEIVERWPVELEAFDAGRLECPPGGESRAAFDRRVSEATARLSRIIAGAGADRTLVVTHGGVLRSVARQHGEQERHIPHLCGYEAADKGSALTITRSLCLTSRRAAGGEDARRINAI
jgi:broad specificity phosphatase PhoE